MTFLYEVQHVITAWSSVVGAGYSPIVVYTYIIIYRLRVYIKKKILRPVGVSGQPETPPPRLHLSAGDGVLRLRYKKGKFV